MATQVDPATLSDKSNSHSEFGYRNAQPELVSKSLVKVTRESAPSMTPQFRRELISASAYLLAEKRGFEPGHEIDDWLAAEVDVDSRNAAT